MKRRVVESHSWFAVRRSYGVLGGILGLLLLGISCGGGGSSNATPSSNFSVSPANTSVPNTQSVQFHALLTQTDGTVQDVTTSALWSSSLPATATVQSIGQEFPGLAKCNAPGETVITAQYQGMVASANLSGVSNTSPQVLTIVPNVVTVPVGNIEQFRAAETNGRDAIEETAGSTWSVSDTSKGAIQSAGDTMPGVFTAKSPGTITVTASAPDGRTATATVVIPQAVSNTFRIPLVDMQPSQNYLGYQGGLYENGSNVEPADHSADGLAAASKIQPLDSNGVPNSSGRIVLLSIGMSNANLEFGVFSQEADQVGSGVNYPTVLVLNGAVESADTCYWTFAQGMPNCPSGGDMGNEYDRVRDTVLANAGVTEAQVQAVWILQADEYPGPDLGLPSLCDPSVSGCVNNVPITSTGTGCDISSNSDACIFLGQLAEVFRAAKSRYPNLNEIFLSSRIYAGYATISLNLEPYSYEYGFAEKWIIQAQIDQIRTGQEDPVAGDVSYLDGSVPWVDWGPYNWADGIQPRLSDGLTWDILPNDDFEADGTHPSDPSGRQKVATILMNFFLNSPYTPWFPAPAKPASAEQHK